MKYFQFFILNILICLFFGACTNHASNSIIPPETNDDTKAKFFIIPQKDKSYISKIENDKIIVTDSININEASKSVIVNNEFICSIDSLITLYDIRGKQLIQINENFTPTCLNSKNRIIYFGGRNNSNNGKSGEIFSLINLNDKDLNLNQIKLPIDISSGKSIDDVLILDDKLILVDNIVYPKYLLEYDISEAKSPKHIETKKLENNGTYEHIIKGDVNEKWLILLSSTISSYASANHITITGESNGQLSAIIIYKNIDLEKYEANQIELPEFKDICLIDNFLYVLANKILMKLDLTNTISENNMINVVTEIKDINKLIKAPDNKLIVVGESGFELIRLN